MNPDKLKRLREQADGQDLYQCRDCGVYWAHTGDFACSSCGSKSADQVQLNPPQPGGTV